MLFISSAAAFSVGQYVKVGASIARITAMTGSTLTVSAPVTASAGTVVIGSASYLLSYQNSGNADATSVVVSDPLPAGWVFVAASPAAASAPAIGANGTVSWSIGTVAAGSGGTLRLEAIPTAVGSTTNTATLTDGAYCTGGSPPASCSSSATTTVGGLRVTKTTSTPNAVAGGAATWTITVSNSLATTVTGVEVTDILPSGFAYSSTGAITAAGATRTATVDPVAGDTQPKWGTWTLPGNGTLSITFTASVGASVGPATYQNDATLVTTTASAGVTGFDPLSTTAEDVTVLASGTGIVNGIVYSDANGNGVYDAAVDSPLAGVAVTIIDSTSTVYVVYTDASGFFSRVVAAGSTIIDVDNGTLPSGLVLTSGTDGVDPSTLTVPDGGVAGRNTGFVAASGTIGNVTGNVWNDANLDAAKNAGEINMLGVQIILRDAVTNAIVAAAYSDVLGNYSFPNVATGNYKVDIVPPSGYFVTTANDPASVTVNSGATATANFGLAQGKILSGSVFKDNGVGGGTADDGLQNGTEAGTNAGGLNVVIVNGADLVLSVAPVSASGAWSAAVPSGTSYKAYVTTASPALGTSAAPATVLPATWVVTKENLNGAVDSTADGALTGINATTNVSGINFGLNSSATTFAVSGLVFNDFDGSGLKNGGETGANVGGLNAILINGVGHVVASTVVAAGGTWSFTGIADGTYTVRLSTTAGIVGNAAPTTSLPIGWFNTGESASGVSTDGSADGNLSITVSGADLTTPTLGIRQRADVIVQKNGPGVVAASGLIGYTVRVYNAGPGAADGTVLTDGVPAGVTGMAWTCGNAVGGAVCPVASGSGAISQTLASLPAGGSLTYTVTATAPASGSFSNSATAAVPSSILDPNMTNNTSSVTTQIGAVPLAADLSVAKYGPSSIAANGSVSYVIVVSNAGPGAANGAIFADNAVAAGLTGVAWTCGNAVGGATCPNTSGTNAISETIATFPAGSSLTYVVSGTAPASGSMINTASISAPPGVTDPNPGNNSSSVTTVVAVTAGSADLAVAKTGPANVAASSVMTYAIVVSNTGPDAVLNARVVDEIPVALTAVTWTCGGGTDGGACITANGSGNAIDTSVNLPAGATITITVSGTAPAAEATFINTARIMPPNGTDDPDPGNNISGPVITHVVTVPSATLPDVFTLINVPASVAGGGVVNALVSYGNQGVASAAGVSYLINLPAGLGAVSCSGANCNYNPATGVVSVSGLPTSLSPGQTEQLTLSYLAPNGTGLALPVTSTIATTSPGETPTANNTASATTITTGSTVLADPTTWISAPPSVYVGETVVVTAGYANLGGSNATGVSFALTGLPVGAVVSYNGLQCSWNSGTGAVTGCGLPNTIPIGQSLMLQASYTAPASGPVTVTSTVSADNDANPANNTATASTTITALPVLPLADVAAALAAPAKANRSSTVLVPVTFSNLGPALASNTGYAITLGGGASNAKVTYNGVPCTYSGGVVSGCGLPVTLNPGQSLGLVLSFTSPPSAATVSIVATVSTTSTEVSTANNVASGAVVISASTPAGTISGRVWYDTNQNSRLDAGESGRPGWTVELMQGETVIAQTLSDANGFYSFTGLDDGVYSVRFMARTGVGATPVNGESGVPVSGGGIPGQSILSNIVIGGGVTAVVQQSLPIDPSGTVYDSTTRQPISGAVVTLTYACGAMDPAWLVGSATVTTGADGNYAFFLQPAAPSACNYSLTVSRGGYSFVSTLIPPNGGTWLAGGGSVSGVNGAPSLGQNTTYYLTGPKPTADLTNNNIPLDAVVVPLPGATPIPTLSEWGVILLSSLVALFGLAVMRRRENQKLSMGSVKPSMISKQ